MKNIFCIRHGLAFHNIKAMEIGSDAYLMEECFDAPLVEKGIQQAKDLGNQWKGLNAVQIVFVSPLTRTLQTCQEIFQAHPGVKIIAHDQVKEYPQGLQICNKRREKLELEKQFPEIDFSGLNSESDEMWRDDRLEEIEELRERIEQFKTMLQGLAETNIAIVSHSAYLNQFLYGTLGDESNALKHCHPYQLEME